MISMTRDSASSLMHLTRDPAPNSPFLSSILTVDEAAKLIRLSPRTVHELVRRRAIPHRRIAGRRRLLFVERELALWLNGCELESRELGDGNRIVRPRPSSTRSPRSTRPVAKPASRGSGDSASPAFDDATEELI